MAIEDTLNEREKMYGKFPPLAQVIQTFKSVYRSSPGWHRLTAVQREVLDMDVVKTCRILYGDPAIVDNWRDKAGYNVLAVEEFDTAEVQKKAMPPATNPVHPNDLLPAEAIPQRLEDFAPKR